MNDTAEHKNPELEDGIHNIQAILTEYPGFATLDDRKSSDEALRAYVSEIAGEFLLHIASLEHHLAQNEEEVVDRSRASQAATEIEMLIDKMQATPYSYSPFFTFDRVPNKLQTAVLRNDTNVLEIVERIKQLMAPTLSRGSNIAALLDTILIQVRELDNRLEDRINAIMELQ